MRNILVLFSIISLSFVSNAQKSGSYLTSDSPVDNLWESADGKDGGAPILEMAQQFFFLIPEGSSGSMMAPFEDEEFGFACPTYFTVSLDSDYLYLEIGEACMADLPEEDKFVKIKYKVNDDSTLLTLIMDGKSYDYKEWAP